MPGTAPIYQSRKPQTAFFASGQYLEPGMLSNYTLREITVADGPAINTLAANCPDAGLISVYSVFRDNAWQSLQALRSDTVGVLAEAPGHAGLAGMGLVSFATCGIQGAVVPCALLNTLMVHPAYRRRGVARRLSEWRIRHTRSRFGDQGVILADVQVGNRASHGMVQKWCNQVLPPITVAPVSLRTRGPGALPGIRVGPVERPALPEFSDRLNEFYKTYTFFKGETARDLSTWLEERPLGLPTRHCLGAWDPQGNLLAGLTLDKVHHLRTYHVARMPAWIRMANRLLHVVPADGVLRQIQADRIWFRPGRVAVARYLWQTARRHWRGRGTCLMVFFDGRSPVASVINLKPWSIKTMMRTVVKTSIPILEDRLIYPIL